MKRLVSILLLLPALALGATSVHPRQLRLDDLRVEDYGAKGDNVADDAPAIQAAIDAASAAGGGVVRLKATTYASGATIAMKSNVRIIGQGVNVTRIRPTGDFTAIEVAAASEAARLENVGIESLRIDAAGTTQTSVAHGIRFFHATTNLVLRDVQVRKVGGKGILLDGDVFFVRATNLIIADAKSGAFTLKGVGAGPGAIPWSNDNTFSDVTVIGGATALRQYEILGDCEGNRFLNVADQSVRVPAGDAVVYVGGNWNTFAHYRVYDPLFDATPLAYFLIDAADAVRNVCYDCSLFASTGFPLVRITGGANGNSFFGLDRVGSPAAVYYVDGSSTQNVIWMNDPAYGNGAGNERLAGSSELISYFSPRYGLKHAGMYDVLYQQDGTNVGATELRAGRYIQGLNETGATRDAGFPVTLRNNVRTDRTVRFHSATQAGTGGTLHSVFGLMAEDGIVASAYGKVQTFGSTKVTGFDCSAAATGDPVFVAAAGGLTLTTPTTGYAMIAGWVTQASATCEVFAVANHLSEYARRRLGMQRFTADPAVAAMEDEEVAVGVVGGVGKVYYKSGGIIYVFTSAATIGP